MHTLDFTSNNMKVTRDYKEVSINYSPGVVPVVYDNIKIMENIARFIHDGARVLEISPYRRPFSKSTHYCGLVNATGLSNFEYVDINCDKLPYDDKYFDFVVCRHVLEDIYNPSLACEEMSRVAKGGFIETPSPFTELKRGLERGAPWRGYIHHRFIVWARGHMLNFVTKHPVIEYMSISDDFLTNVINSNPELINMYFLWFGKLNYHIYEQDIDFILEGTDSKKTYERLLERALKDYLDEAQRMEGEMPTFSRSPFVYFKYQSGDEDNKPEINLQENERIKHYFNEIMAGRCDSETLMIIINKLKDAQNISLAIALMEKWINNTNRIGEMSFIESELCSLKNSLIL